MGSKKDEKYRIHILDIGIIVDFKEMITYGTQEFEQIKNVIRLKNGTLKGKDAEIFFRKFYAWLFERETVFNGPRYNQLWMKTN